MLVLARGKNESIIINDNIEITIVEIRSDQVKIGIQAPKNVKINRKEIYEKIKLEMKKAATSNLPDFETPKLENLASSLSNQESKPPVDPSKKSPNKSTDVKG